MSKATEFRQLTDEELDQRERDARQEMFRLRMQQTAGQMERPSRMREVRRDIARIRTTAAERRKGST